jgi:hypothetical protein
LDFLSAADENRATVNTTAEIETTRADDSIFPDSSPERSAQSSRM